MENLYSILRRELFPFESQITHLGDRLTLINDMEDPYAGVPPDMERFNQALAVPFRIEGVALVYCDKGEFECRLNLRDYTMQGGDLLLVAPHSIGEIPDGFDAWTLIIGIGEGFLPSEVGVMDYMGLHQLMMSRPLVHLDDKQRKQFVRTFKLLEETVKDETNTYRENIAKSYMKVLYLYCHNALRQVSEAEPFEAYGTLLFHRFLELVNQHFKDERRIGFYADKLCLSPKYASQLIRKVSGKLAGDWIRERVILEAKLLLTDGRHNVQQAAEELHFISLPAFSKYFKIATRLSPKEFMDAVICRG